MGQVADRQMTNEGECKEIGYDKKSFAGGEGTSDGWSEKEGPAMQRSGAEHSGGGKLCQGPEAGVSWVSLGPTRGPV